MKTFIPLQFGLEIVAIANLVLCNYGLYLFFVSLLYTVKLYTLNLPPTTLFYTEKLIDVQYPGMSTTKVMTGGCVYYLDQY